MSLDLPVGVGLGDSATEAADATDATDATDAMDAEESTAAVLTGQSFAVGCPNS